AIAHTPFRARGHPEADLRSPARSSALLPRQIDFGGGEGGGGQDHCRSRTGARTLRDGAGTHDPALIDRSGTLARGRIRTEGWGRRGAGAVFAAESLRPRTGRGSRIRRETFPFRVGDRGDATESWLRG